MHHHHHFAATDKLITKAHTHMRTQIMVRLKVGEEGKKAGQDTKEIDRRQSKFKIFCTAVFIIYLS